MTDMDYAARVWLLQTAREHYWRVAAWYEFDDLVQDGNECWVRVVAKYEERDYVTKTGVRTKKSRRVRSQKHLMSLFQRTFLNHIHDLSKHRSREAVEVRALDIIPEDAIIDTVWDHLIEYDCDVLAYERLTVEAPEPVRTLLRALITEDKASRLLSAYRVLRSHRETTNERLCKIAGIEPGSVNLRSLLERYLRNQLIAA